MMNVDVWNKDLERIGTIAEYTSLIWADRWVETGDCELYLLVTQENLRLLKKNYFLSISDSETFCIIRRIELTSDEEAGDYMIVHGYDAKVLLYQRILWKTYTNSGKAEKYLANLVIDSVIHSSISDVRNMIKPNGDPLVDVGLLHGYTETLDDQDGFVNLGDKISSVCEQFGWGWYMQHEQALSVIEFGVKKGTDRSLSVVFDPAFCNFNNLDYVDDITHMGNVVLVLGAGENGHRPHSISGAASSSNRFELFLDKNDESTEMTWAELTAAFPLEADGGNGRVIIDVPTQKYYYAMINWTFVVPPGNLENWIEDHIENAFFYDDDGVRYCSLGEARIALLESETPADDDSCMLTSLARRIFLVSNGITQLQDYGETITFDGVLINDVNFAYGEDFKLGDIVTIRHPYGITEQVRVIEAVHVWDETGHQLQINYTKII